MTDFLLMLGVDAWENDDAARTFHSGLLHPRQSSIPARFPSSLMLSGQ
jgi:hypothetical protein